MAEQLNKIQQQTNNDLLLNMITVQVLKPKVYNFPTSNMKKKYQRNRSLQSKPNPQSPIKARNKNQYNWKPLFLLHNKISDFKIQPHRKPKKLLINHFDTLPAPQVRNCFRGLKYKSQISQKKRPFTASKIYSQNISTMRSVQEKRPPQRNFSTMEYEDEDLITTRRNQKMRKTSVVEAFLSYRKWNRKKASIETEMVKKLNDLQRNMVVNSWSEIMS